MITIRTRRGAVAFPTTVAEAEKWKTETLRMFLMRNDPNGEWDNEGEDGPTRDELIEQAVAFGQELEADGVTQLPVQDGDKLVPLSELPGGSRVIHFRDRESILRTKARNMERSDLEDLMVALALQVDAGRGLATIEGADDPVREASEFGEECETTMQAILEDA